MYGRFWLAVQDLKRMPQQDVAQRAQDIWAEFLAEGAPSSINLDSHSYERTSQNLKDPGRYCYEDAQVSKTREGQGEGIVMRRSSCEIYLHGSSNQSNPHCTGLRGCAITMILKSFSFFPADPTVKPRGNPLLAFPRS